MKVTPARRSASTQQLPANSLQQTGWHSNRYQKFTYQEEKPALPNRYRRTGHFTCGDIPASASGCIRASPYPVIPHPRILRRTGNLCRATAWHQGNQIFKKRWKHETTAYPPFATANNVTVRFYAHRIKQCSIPLSCPWMCPQMCFYDKKSLIY